MIDFPFTEVNIWCPLYCLILYWIVLYNNYAVGIESVYSIRVSAVKKRWAIMLVALLIITHCLQGDFFHMLSAVKAYSAVPGAYNYGEPFYVSLGLLLERNYLLFRTIVFGGAFGIFCLTARRMRVPIYNAIIILLASYVIIFSYARATLAMSVFFLGLSFLCNPIRKYKCISYMVGVGVILLSRNFHSSAIIMIMSTLALFVPVNKVMIFVVLFISPFVFHIFQDLFLSLMQDGSMGENINTKIQTYLDLERDGLGLSGYIINTLEYSSFYIPLILITYCVYKQRFNIRKDILRMYKVMIMLLYCSILFIFMGDAFLIYVYRVLFMTMIPIVIISYRLYMDGCMNKKQFLWCIKPGILYVVVKYIYSVYCIIVTS